MLNFKGPQAGTSVQYSPFIDNRLALGTAANFGIVGNGRVFSLNIMNSGEIVVQNSFDTQDSVQSVAWSELHENHLGVACGDGTVQLFDTQRPHPLLIFKEHQREASSIDWDVLNKHQFCSSSWDGTIKVWTSDGPLGSILTLSAPSSAPVSSASTLSRPGSENVIYEAKFSPRSPGLIGSAHADGRLVIWDTRQGTPTAQMRAPLGSGESLTMDWNKYRPETVASAGSDGIIRIWDLRNPSNPLTNELRGHQLAVKSLKWSPHSPIHLLSASYDMTARVWQDTQGRVVPSTGPRGLVGEFRRHTEFLTSCDWSLWGQPGWVATTSFDSMVYLWKAV